MPFSTSKCVISGDRTPEGLTLLQTLPATPERNQRELALQTTLGTALSVTQGYAAPDVGKTYARARELCQHLGETSQLFPVLWGLWYFYFVRAEFQPAWEVGQQLLTLAQREGDSALLMQAYIALGNTSVLRGELTASQEYYTRGIGLYDPQQHRSLVLRFFQDPKVTSLATAVRVFRTAIL